MNSYNLQSQGPKNSVAGYFSQQNVLFGFRIRTFGIKKKPTNLSLSTCRACECISANYRPNNSFSLAIGQWRPIDTKINVR